MTTAYEAPHVIAARQTQEAALKHRCPFCRSDPGQLCRAQRGAGRELDHSHSRRIALSKPQTETTPKRQRALCCVCGQQRTVSANHFAGSKDPNTEYTNRGKGWRSTKTLKCDACGEQTRHAVLRAEDETRPDWDEIHQRIALGDPDRSKYPFSEESIKRLRKEYRELFPRNPYLKHRYFVKEAKAAWADGSKTVIALCGEQITLKTDPGRPSKKKDSETPGELVAEQLGDTEYEDPDTGLWWIDMDCVDCCRVSNRKHWDEMRDRLKWFFMHFALKMEDIPDLDVGVLEEHLDKLWTQSKEKPQP